jgi:hypothetical protein
MTNWNWGGMGITTEIANGIADVVMDNPPVDALTVAGWYEVVDLWDVNRSYGYGQGFAFEVNLLGVADEHPDRFVEKGARG